MAFAVATMATTPGTAFFSTDARRMLSSSAGLRFAGAAAEAAAASDTANNPILVVMLYLLLYRHEFRKAHPLHRVRHGREAEFARNEWRRDHLCTFKPSHAYGAA